VTALSPTAPPSLHVPAEPEERRAAWLAAVLAGDDLADVVTGADGPARWLWARWRDLAGAGLAEESFVAIALGYRRELWLWLVGDRTWDQCCSGLIGRLERRLTR